MFRYHEKKIIAELLYIEMHKNNLTTKKIAEELIMPENHIIQIMMGNVAYLTVQAIFEMLQKIYHGLDIEDLEKHKLLVDYDAYEGDFFLALGDFLVQERFHSREKKKEEG